MIETKKIKDKYGLKFIPFVIVLFVILLAFLSNLDKDRVYYEFSEEQYNALWEKIYYLSDKIGTIENKYADSEGYFSLYKFTKEDLGSYANFTAEQQQNYNNLVSWVINNEKYIKHIGKSELFISESLNEWRSTIQKLEERTTQIKAVQPYIEILNNYNGAFSTLFNSSFT